MISWSLIFSNALYAAISANAAAYCLIATGLNVHFGYTGLLNFGQAAFAAVGAYAFAIPIANYGWPGTAALPFVFVVLDPARPPARHPDPAAARRLPRHRHHRGSPRSSAIS